MTLSCLLGGENATDRPMVQVKMSSSSNSEKFLYDSGAQVSLVGRKAFRKIPVNKRPEKINFRLTCSGVSGSKLKVLGCYMMKVKILDKEIEHPFFIVDKIPGQSGVIGIDVIKKFGLSLDVITNEPYFVNKIPEAIITKDVHLPARSRQKVKVKIPKNCLSKNGTNWQVLSINVPAYKQVHCDEIIIDANEDGFANAYLTNVSQTNIRLKKHSVVGEVEPISDCDMSPFPVSATTPLANSEEVAKFKKNEKEPILDEKRKKKILEAANLGHLAPEMRDKYIQILYKHHLCISLDEFDLGKCKIGSHNIPTMKGTPPTYSKQFPLPYEHEKEVRRQILEWLKIGVIRPCESEYNSSLFLVAKKPPPAKPGDLSPRPKAYRVVQDLRALNKATMPSNVRLPEIHECLDRIAQKKPSIFSSLDLRSGYFQLPIQKESQEKTAFTSLSLGQQYCFNVTSQGLTSAPASFSRTMQRIFCKQIANNDLEVYLDDVLAYSKTHKEMLQTLDKALENLSISGMKINIEKCQFGIDKLTYLGFEINKDGFKQDPVKSEGITNVAEPSTLKGVRSFMGMANFYRLLIPKFSKLTSPLTKLTCKGEWSGGDLPKDAKIAFKKCQDIFSNRPFLHYPDFNLEFHLFVDASLGDLDDPRGGGLAGCLVQYPKNDTTAKCRPIGFCSRSLKSHERNYSAHLVETLGIIFGIEYFDKYLKGLKFIVHTDHKPLCTIKEGKVHKRTLERFKVILAEYDFSLVYTPGISMPSDYLSRHVKVDSVRFESIGCKELKQELEKEVQGQIEPNEKVEVRACSAWQNKKNEGVEVDKQKRARQPVDLGGRAQQLWAQAQECAVQAMIAEQHIGPAKPPEPVKEATPSKRVNDATCSKEKAGPQPSANYTTLSANGMAKLPTLSSKINDTARQLRKIARQANRKDVVKVVKGTLKEKISEAAIQLKKLNIFGVKSQLESFNLLDTSPDKNLDLLKKQQKLDPFIQSIKYFITDKVLPSKRYRNTIKTWGPHCYEKKGLMLVKHNRPGFATRELIIAPGERISNIIAECHGSLLGGHDGLDKTVNRILSTYWFPGIYTETQFFIDNCSVCNRLKKKSKVSNTMLKPLKQADRIFERVHLDLFGPLKTHTGKSYIMTVVDSFSKYARFIVIPDKKATTVAANFFDNWVAIFGSPLSILTDQGTDFKTETLAKICEYLQIDKRLISTKHPQANSQAEVLNKKLSKYIKAMETDGEKDWPALVNSCQWAYNLSIHTALKNSPYSVLFGIDPNTPLNNFGFVSDPIYGPKYQHKLGQRLQLARQLAMKNNMEYREDYVKRFNKTVKPHDFQKGMLVFLHRPEKLQINPKLQSPWFGPYVILEMIGDHNSLIQELSNKKTKFVNVNRLRQYDNSIKDWNNFRLTYDKSKAKKNAGVQKSDNAIMQKPDKKNCNDPETACAHKHAHAPHAPAMAEFDSANEITILNPEDFETHRPIPGSPGPIKVEPQDMSGTFSSGGSDEYEDTNQTMFSKSISEPTPDPTPEPVNPQPGTSGRSPFQLPGITDTLQDIFGSRRSRRRQIEKLPAKSFAEIEKDLKTAEKAGKNSGKNTKKTKK